MQFLMNKVRNTEEGDLASEVSLLKGGMASVLGGKSCVITLLVGGKAVRWNTGLQGAVFACFLKNIMLHKTGSSFQSVQLRIKKGKQKSTIISIARNSYYYYFSLHTLPEFYLSSTMCQLEADQGLQERQHQSHRMKSRV